MSVLQIQAGRTALAHIRQHGLSPDDIDAVFGASGAAKWLTICGLDCAVFGDWLSQSQQPVALMGTSVGAMKLAAAVQPDCRTRLTEFAARYALQQYEDRPTPEAVGEQTQAVIEAALGPDGADHLLRHPRYQYHCGAVHVSRGLASSSPRTQVSAMLRLAGTALRGRRALRRRITRVVCGVPLSQTESTSGESASVSRPIASQDGMDTVHLTLTHDNLKSALLASGSIPVYLDAVQLPEPAGVVVDSSDQLNYQGRREDRQLLLRDGGLLDYHPVPENLCVKRTGLVLYPHFYSTLRECWFDKFYPWRKVPAHRLDNVILVSPTQEFVRSLPGGRIPDRRDFTKFAGRDDQRIRQWQEATARSEELGEAWREITRRGNWAEVVQPIS